MLLSFKSHALVILFYGMLFSPNAIIILLHSTMPKCFVTICLFWRKRAISADFLWQIKIQNQQNNSIAAMPRERTCSSTYSSLFQYLKYFDAGSIKLGQPYLGQEEHRKTARRQLCLELRTTALYNICNEMLKFMSSILLLIFSPILIHNITQMVCSSSFPFLQQKALGYQHESFSSVNIHIYFPLEGNRVEDNNSKAIVIQNQDVLPLDDNGLWN